MLVVEAAIKANHKQKTRMITKIINNMNGVSNKTIAILGLSFKPETDDMRDAPSIDIIKGLIESGAKIRTFCPKGMVEAQWRLADSAKDIYYAKDEYDASASADAIVLITEWNQFRGLDLIELKKNMQGSFFFDLRNVFSRSREIRRLFNYFAVGQKS
ncbi:UDP binding domain-containing protein [Aquella oligotrophica]|uniref:UDP binding domain-containing protein n=1 Tax=Aquella oligotrophica TaxID=2067065 RepID=UPI003CC615F8